MTVLLLGFLGRAREDDSELRIPIKTISSLHFVPIHPIILEQN